MKSTEQKTKKANAPEAATSPTAEHQSAPATDPSVTVPPTKSAGSEQHAPQTQPTKSNLGETEKAQPALFGWEAAIKGILSLQGRALKHDRFCTVLCCRAGLQLLTLKEMFKRRRQRTFCAFTEQCGVKPWFRKRAMQLAKHFREEEACKDIPLLEALKMSRKQPKSQGVKRKPASTAVGTHNDRESSRVANKYKRGRRLRLKEIEHAITNLKDCEIDSLQEWLESLIDRRETKHKTKGSAVLIPA